MQEMPYADVENLPPNKKFEYIVQHKYLDKIYQDHGLTVAERIPPGEFGEYDVALEKDDIRMRIEEKIVRGVYENILVELIEDIESGKVGWYFRVNADYLVWVFCRDEIPEQVWMIKWPEFKRWYAENCDKINPLIRFHFNKEGEGWGKPFYHLIPLAVIPEELKKKIYQK